MFTRLGKDMIYLPIPVSPKLSVILHVTDPITSDDLLICANIIKRLIPGLLDGEGNQELQTDDPLGHS